MEMVVGIKFPIAWKREWERNKEEEESESENGSVEVERFEAEVLELKGRRRFVLVWEAKSEEEEAKGDRGNLVTKQRHETEKERDTIQETNREKKF